MQCETDAVIGMTVRGFLFVACITVATVIIAAFGVWQLQMAVEDKERRNWMIEQEGRPPLQIDSHLEVADRYRLAEAMGEFDSGGTLLIGNRISSGRIGYQVLSPFRVLPGNVIFFVDRGWLAAGKIPGDTPNVAVPSGELFLSGQLILPAGKPPFFGKNDVVATGNVWRYIDIDDARVWTGMPLEPLVLKLDAASTAETVFFSDDSVMSENRGARFSRFAAQWFLLALLFPILFLAAWRRQE